MTKPSKEKLVRTYQRLVDENGGKRIGERVFMRETGYSHHNWKGTFWRSWSAFQKEAGYEPNTATEKTPDALILRRYAELALEMEALPSEADLILKRKEDPSFPSKSTYRRWGSRTAMLDKVGEFCEDHEEFAPVLHLLKQGLSATADRRVEAKAVKGFVYLLRSGKS